MRAPGCRAQWSYARPCCTRALASRAPWCLWLRAGAAQCYRAAAEQESWLEQGEWKEKESEECGYGFLEWLKYVSLFAFRISQSLIYISNGSHCHAGKENGPLAGLLMHRRAWNGPTTKHVMASRHSVSLANSMYWPNLVSLWACRPTPLSLFPKIIMFIPHY